MRLLVLILLFFSFGLTAQIGTGQWRLHMSSKEAIEVVALSDRVYTAYNTGISEYNYSSKEITIWNAVNALSSLSVTSMAYCSSEDAIFIGYEDGNIDKIKSNKITNIPAIKLAELLGSKKINKIVEHEGFMYLATGFSVVKLDPSKNEIKDTYYPTNGNTAILDLTFVNDSIFALTSDRLYLGSVNNVALADPTQWNVDNRVPTLFASNNYYKEIETFNDTVYLLYKVDGYGLDTIYKINETSLSSAVAESFPLEVTSLNNVNNELVVNFDFGSLTYNESLVQAKYIGQYSAGGAPRINSLSFNNGVYWLADRFSGSVKFTDNSNSETVEVGGPPKKDVYKMDWHGNKLVVAGGALSGKWQTYNTSGIYIFEDEKWRRENPTVIENWVDSNVADFLSVAINPIDETIIATGTYSTIPLALVKSSGGVEELFSVNNSILEAPSGNAAGLVTHVEYDETGNLWMLNPYTDNVLKVYDKDKVWHEFSLPSSSINKFTKALAIDYNGNKWVSVEYTGVFGYNDNGTINNPSDDKTVFLNSGEFSGALPSNDVNAIAVDFDNEIWIGTNNGFAVLYNSAGSFDASDGDYNAQRIKLEFEGNVEYVLGSTKINDIEVDGANRKWFATENSGIILLSPDGLEVLEHHTMDNSPIISNNVLDLQLNQNTGELYIITDLGLVSYRTDATYEDPLYSNVKVFPNPARPEFEGPITIQGIRYNSDVKITDVSGKLVYKTTSNGGTATWDGKTLNGEKVPTGVYLIWTAANEGKGRKVGKVLIVN